jgi:hypothetical protein
MKMGLVMMSGVVAHANIRADSRNPDAIPAAF